MEGHGVRIYSGGYHEVASSTLSCFAYVCECVLFVCWCFKVTVLHESFWTCRFMPIASSHLLSPLLSFDHFHACSIWVVFFGYQNHGMVLQQQFSSRIRNCSVSHAMVMVDIHIFFCMFYILYSKSPQAHHLNLTRKSAIRHTHSTQPTPPHISLTGKPLS